MAVGHAWHGSGWVLPLQIMQTMRHVFGHLHDEEADLLLATVMRALSIPGAPGTIVEIGSFHGKSTVVLGLVAKAVGPHVKVYSIDPHEGELSKDDPAVNVAPTYEAFTQNMASAGLTYTVVPVRKRSTDVEWARPVSMLFIDALHDYDSVAQDFARFAPWVIPGGYIAFHDYGNPDFPGVFSFVNEIVTLGYGEPAQRAAGLIVLEKPANRSSLRGSPPPEAGWAIDDYWRS
jgi:cephalosporin hydroxylase